VAIAGLILDVCKDCNPLLENLKTIELNLTNIWVV